MESLEYFETDLKKGDLLNNRYELVEKIGQGGFGSVYKILDKENEKKE